MDLTLLLPAFLAGILTFLAPCTLPLVPGYLGFISDVSLNDINNDTDLRKAKRKIFFNGFFFIVGFSLIFISFGIMAGILGTALAPWRIWLTRIGGVFVIIFGFFMLNVIKIPWLSAEHRLSAPSWLKRGKPFNSLLLGGAFATGWTPCVGPILGSILLLASTSTTALQGGIMLTAFSAGLAIPFLVIAAGFGSASAYITKISKYLRVVSFIGGIFLIVLGILLLTNKMALLISYGFELFGFLDYEQLLQFL